MRDSHCEKRNSGIALVGDLPWGSHFCQFYKTQDDTGAGISAEMLPRLFQPFDSVEAIKALLAELPSGQPAAGKGAAEASIASSPPSTGGGNNR